MDLLEPRETELVPGVVEADDSLQSVLRAVGLDELRRELAVKFEVPVRRREGDPGCPEPREHRCEGLDARLADGWRVIEPVEVAQRDIPAAECRTDSARELDVPEARRRQLPVVDDPGRRRRRPPARREGHTARGEDRDDDQREAGGPACRVEGGGVDTQLLVVDRVEVVVRVDVVRRVVGVAGPPGVDLLAERELRRIVPEANDGFHQIEMAPPGRGVGYPERNALREVAVVRARVPDQFDAGRWSELASPLHLQDPFIANLAIVRRGFLEVGEILEDNLASDAGRRLDGGLGRETFAAAGERRRNCRREDHACRQAAFSHHRRRTRLVAPFFGTQVVSDVGVLCQLVNCKIGRAHGVSLCDSIA